MFGFSADALARRRAVILAILLSTVPPLNSEETASNTQLVIIAAPGRDAGRIDAAMLAGIYRRKILVDDDGRSYVPVNLPAIHPLRRLFSRLVFDQSPEQMQGYWNEQYFKGISPPFVVASPDASLRFVATTPGAIGYVLDCQLIDSVKVIIRLPIPPSATELAAESCRDPGDR
jgi:hypothetical protein